LVIVAIGLAVALWRTSPRRPHPGGTAGAPGSAGADPHADPAT
jgi:hypothetical protein